VRRAPATALEVQGAAGDSAFTVSRRPAWGRHLGWIVPLAVLHAVLAAPGLSDSIWLDEAVTVRLCLLPSSLHTTAANDATPPVYYLVTHAWAALFGCGLEGLRALSLLFSELSLLLLFALGARRFNLHTAILASALFVASNLQLHYATEARCYALVGLLVLVSYWTFFALREPAARRAPALLAVVNATIVQTHYVAVLGLLPQLADVFVFRWHDRAVRARFLRSQLLAVALCAPWAAYVLLHWPPITPHWIGLPDVDTLGYDFRVLLGTSLEPLWYVLASVAVLAAIRVRAPDRLRGSGIENVTILAGWGIGAPLLAFAASRSISVVLPRYLLFAALGLALLLSYLVSIAPLRDAGRLLLSALLLAPTLANLTSPALVRPDWRHAVDLVKERWSPSSTRVVVSPEWEDVSFAYYLIDPAERGVPEEIARELGPTVQFARDPDAVVAELPAEIRTLILVTDETFDHPLVLSMPQMCFFTERRVLHPRLLAVRVFDRDCAIR
jgi:hypothetical protein